MPDAPIGFGKGVNDYYNQYILLTDGKAAAVFGVSAALVAALVAPDARPTTSVGSWAMWAALGALAGAISCAAWVVIPQLPSGRRGVVFWEDVQTFSDYSAYQDEVRKLTAADVEAEYAAQNFFVSKVVHRKMLAARIAIVLLLLGLAAAVVRWIAG